MHTCLTARVSAPPSFVVRYNRFLEKEKGFRKASWEVARTGRDGHPAALWSSVFLLPWAPCFLSRHRPCLPGYPFLLPLSSLAQKAYRVRLINPQTRSRGAFRQHLCCWTQRGKAVWPRWHSQPGADLQVYPNHLMSPVELSPLLGNFSWAQGYPEKIK